MAEPKKDIPTEAMGSIDPDMSDMYGEDADRMEEMAVMLDALGLQISQRRSEAIDWRQQTGIENEWVEDEEHYEGVDEANRHETTWRSKPPGLADTRESGQSGSTAFFNITRPYVDAASARVGDMLLPTDDRGWAIKPTPVPALMGVAEGKFPAHLEMEIASEHPDDPEGAMQAKQSAQDQAKQQVNAAKEKADRAAEVIEDWHVECQFHAEMRTVIESSTKLGTGVLKGPIPMKRKQVAFKDGALIIEEKLAPHSYYVDLWNCFPAPGCGQSIHNGDFFFERDDISPKKLRDLKGQPGYIDYQIDKCLKEKPMRAIKEFDTENRGSALFAGLEARRENQFELWYFYGYIERDDLLACGCSEEDIPEDLDYIPAILEIVNNHVIKAAVNPLDTGEFPYDFMVWQRREGLPWGIGVSRQVRVPQRVVNAAGRNMLNNAGVSGSPMMIFKQGIVVPVDGVYEVAPFKMWMVTEDADIDDVGRAFTFVQIPAMQQELENIILFGLKMAEDITGLPMLLQGQMGNAPDTVGGMRILNDNAGAPLRRIARLFDDLITEPHIRRYYSYLLQYGEDDAKGDFQIDARGSSALVERDINNQAIREMAEVVSNPVFGLDPKKWAQEFLKAQRLDARRFEYDDEEWEQTVQQLQAAAQKPDSAVEVAQIRAQVEQMKAQLQSQDKAEDRELQIALEAMRKQKEDQEREWETALKAVEREMEMLGMDRNSSEHDKDIKASLAETIAKLRVQVALAKNQTGAAKQVLTPPTEPPAHAEDGKAYQQ